MQIMVVVGDIIGKGCHLRLGAGMGGEFQIMARAILRQRPRHGVRDGAIMFGDAFKRFPSEVESVKFGVMPLECCDDPDGLSIMIKPAIRRHQIRERILARMSERCVPQIMGQRHGLGQLRIQPKRSRNRARHLRHFDRMGQAGAVIIALMFDKDLGFMLEPPKGRSVDDPVTIPLETGAEGAFLLRHQSAAALAWIAGINSAHMLSLCPCRSVYASIHERYDNCDTGFGYSP